MTQKLFRILSFILIVLTSVIFFQCEKYIEFDDEIKDPKIVLNSQINPDSSFKVNLTRSLSVIDDGELSVIENALVEVYDQNNTFLEQLTYIGDGNYLGMQKPSVGQSYSVSAQANNYENVSAITSVPPSVPIIAVDTFSFSDPSRGDLMSISIQFNDPSGDNYYVLEVLEGDTAFGAYYYPMYFTSDDIALDLGNDNYTSAATFTDELFDGSSKTLEIELQNVSMYVDYLEIRLTSASKDLYDYERTQEAYQFSNGDPFAQPVQVYSNIEGGFGIFAGDQVDKHQIIF